MAVSLENCTSNQIAFYYPCENQSNDSSPILGYISLDPSLKLSST